MELIDRQAFLKNKVWNCGGSPHDPYYNGYSDALDRVQEVLEAAPTVDAVPLVHGEWTNEGDGDWRCSACRSLFTFDDYGDMHPRDDCGCYYCPNCGAKMDGDV